MQKKSIELVFILDKSGSMQGLEKDTIGGFNSMLAKQKQSKNSVFVTTILFDDYYEILHDRLEIHTITEIDENDYLVRGTTALLDAMGKTIKKIGKFQKSLPAEEKAEKILFVIITDGEENASRKFSIQQIKKMIEKKKEKHNWEFIFLGANIDAIETAKNYGIDEACAQSYHADEEGIALNYEVLSDCLLAAQEEDAIPKDWNRRVKSDFENRKVKE